MRAALWVAALLALTGCDRGRDGSAGRFQMVPAGGGKEGVYVLDTQKGRVWSCTPSMTTGAPLCGLPTILSSGAPTPD
jgi:hypothetical protein